jgi:transposase
VDTQLGVARLRKDDESMGKSRRRHSREFKLEAVKQVVELGRPVSEVADSLGVNRNMLSAWKKQLLAEGALAFPGQGKRNEADEEIARLRRELAIARQERDILKKAAAYFANDKS